MALRVSEPCRSPEHAAGGPARTLLSPRRSRPVAPARNSTPKRSDFEEKPRLLAAPRGGWLPRPRRFGPAQSLFSAVTAEPLLQGGVSSRGAPSRGSLGDTPRGSGWAPEGLLSLHAARGDIPPAIFIGHRESQVQPGFKGGRTGVHPGRGRGAWPGARAPGLEERVRLDSGCCDQVAQAGGL